MTSTIDVRLLGPIEVRVDEAAVDLGGPQPRAVIAHLALDLGRVVPVAEARFGDPARAQARTVEASELAELHANRIVQSRLPS